MAKRNAAGRKRKAARKTPSRPRKTARRAAAKQTRGRAAARKTTRGRRPAAKPRAKKSARSAAPKKMGTARAAAKPRTSGSAKRPASAGARPKPVALDRERRRLTEDITAASAPSTLGYAARASSAESGHQAYQHRQREHTEGGSALTGGDVDTDWNEAYSSGEETPGGDMPTPDQDVVEEIGRALGVEYDDAEELKGATKIEERDRHRWEYDPASAEDYKDRNRRDED